MLYADYIRKRIHHLFKVIAAAGYPITLLKSMGKALKDYRIYGNTVQDSAIGTNLIKTTYLALEGTEVDVSVTGDTALAATETYVFAFVTVGCTYVDNTLALFEVTYSDNTVVPVPPTETYKILNEDGKTLTGIKFVNKCGCTGTVKRISCYTGRKPYKDVYSEISSVGDLNSDTGKYEIPVTVRGKNLMSIERDVRQEYASGVIVEKGTDYVIAQMSASAENREPGSVYNSSGWIGINSLQATAAAFNECFFKDIKPSTTYTLSYDFEYFYLPDGLASVSHRGQFSISGKDKYITMQVTEAGKKYHYKLTFTTPETITVIAFFFTLSSCKVKFSNIMLEEGGSETDYERYVEPVNYTIQLDEPLRSIYNKTDYVDFKSKKVVRNVHEFIVRKSNLIRKNPSFEHSYGWNGYNFMFDVDRYYVNPYTRWAITTYFADANEIYSNALTKPYLFQGSSNKYPKEAYFVTTPASSETVTDFGNWIEEKYTEGKPVKLVYAIAEPIEENVDLPEIFTLKGTSIIEVNSSIPPSNMEVKYISK